MDDMGEAPMIVIAVSAVAAIVLIFMLVIFSLFVCCLHHYTRGFLPLVASGFRKTPNIKDILCFDGGKRFLSYPVSRLRRICDLRLKFLSYML